MFKISFSPQYSDRSLSLEKQGDTLIVNGDPLDFSDLPDGTEYPEEAIDNHFVIGGVSRDGDAVHLTVLFPYAASGHFDTPDAITVTRDGPITLPEASNAVE